MENKLAKKISLTIPESVSKHIPNVSIPEFTLPKFTAPDINVPKVTIPEEARRPIYATVGAAEVAVERVRDAVATLQERAVDTKNLSGKKSVKFGEMVGDNVASASKAASTAYAEFTRRGEETLGRIWPETATTTEAAPAKVTKPKATTKAAPKKRTAPKAAAAKATAPKATAPKATAPKAAAPKAAAKPTEVKVAEVKVAAVKPVEVKTADKPASE